jgi:hypothetical protein
MEVLRKKIFMPAATKAFTGLSSRADALLLQDHTATFRACSPIYQRVLARECCKNDNVLDMLAV